MEKFIVENGNNGYYKTYSLLETNIPLGILNKAEELTRPTRFSSTGGSTMKQGIELMDYACNILISESKVPIEGNYLVYKGSVGNY